MRPEILIVGQGLAGTLLGCECERAGLSFAIMDGGHAQAASWAAAGIINPITGRRVVKSWRIDALLPVARAAYQEFELTLGVPLWRQMRVHRLFADERERATFREKHARGELAPFADAGDDDGFWIRDAALVDVRALLTAARERWTRTKRMLSTAEPNAYELVIDCTGNAITRRPDFGFVPWEFSKGEILEIKVDGLDPNVVRNRGQWLVPVDAGRAWVGATHQPGVRTTTCSDESRAALETAARTLLGAEPFEVTGQRAGVRVNVRDKHPVAGRHPANARLGLINGLGAKGALWAPMLARQWVSHLTTSTPFDPEVDVGRFAA